MSTTIRDAVVVLRLDLDQARQDASEAQRRLGGTGPAGGPEESPATPRSLSAGRGVTEQVVETFAPQQPAQQPAQAPAPPPAGRPGPGGQSTERRTPGVTADEGRTERRRKDRRKDRARRASERSADRARRAGSALVDFGAGFLGGRLGAGRLAGGGGLARAAGPVAATLLAAESFRQFGPGAVQTIFNRSAALEGVRMGAFGKFGQDVVAGAEANLTGLADFADKTNQQIAKLTALVSALSQTVTQVTGVAQLRAFPAEVGGEVNVDGLLDFSGNLFEINRQKARVQDRGEMLEKRALNRVGAAAGVDLVEELSTSAWGSFAK